MTIKKVIECTTIISIINASAYCCLMLVKRVSRSFPFYKIIFSENFLNIGITQYPNGNTSYHTDLQTANQFCGIKVKQL